MHKKKGVQDLGLNLYAVAAIRQTKFCPPTPPQEVVPPRVPIYGRRGVKIKKNHWAVISVPPK